MKLLAVFILSIALTIPYEEAVSQRQGVQGEVLWFSGNLIPGPNRESSAPGSGVQRELFFYKVLTLEEVGHTGPFFPDLKGELVATVTSRPNGHFKVKLPPGSYSVFVKEKNGLFANLFDASGQINPVTVKEKQFAWLIVTVDYEAAY